MPGIIFGFICVGIGFFFLAGSYYAYLDYTRVQKYSGRASGQVTKKYSLIASDGSGNYYLDYSFVSSAGSKINASSSIAKQQWDTLHVGDALEIRYDLSDHNRSIPMYGGSPSLIFVFFIFVLGGVFLVFGASRLMENFKRQKLAI
ncbi:MAG: DUF3592 domain-containing protein [Smithellaceae bacterium]